MEKGRAPRLAIRVSACERQIVEKTAKVWGSAVGTLRKEKPICDTAISGLPERAEQIVREYDRQGLLTQERKKR